MVDSGESIGIGNECTAKPSPYILLTVLYFWELHFGCASPYKFVGVVREPSSQQLHCKSGESLEHVFNSTQLVSRAHIRVERQNIQD